MIYSVNGEDQAGPEGVERIRSQESAVLFSRRKTIRRRTEVCLVAPLPPPYGGIAHWTSMLVGYMDGYKRTHVRVVNTAPRWRRIEDLRVWKRAIGGGASLWYHLFLVLWRLFAGCDVVHVTSAGQLAVLRDIAVLGVARLFRVPTFYHLRFGRVPAIASSDTREWRMLALAMRLARTVLAIDESTRDAIRKHLPDVQVLLLPNCIELGKLPRRMASAPPAVVQRVVFLGWVIPTKGVEELVEAWSSLQHCGWSLDIIGPGDGEYQRGLVEKYRPDGLAFVGEVPHAEAMRYLANADLFVLPSYTEGFPNAVLEAMAMGTPIIASCVGAIPEMLGDNCGVLVPPREVEPLKEALAKMMEDELFRQGCGESARRRAEEEYSLPRVFGRLTKLWDDSLASTVSQVRGDRV